VANGKPPKTKPKGITGQLIGFTLFRLTGKTRAKAGFGVTPEREGKPPDKNTRLGFKKKD